jgi:hypothetical protein
MAIIEYLFNRIYYWSLIIVKIDFIRIEPTTMIKLYFRFSLLCQTRLAKFTFKEFLNRIHVEIDKKSKKNIDVLLEFQGMYHSFSLILITVRVIIHLWATTSPPWFWHWSYIIWNLKRKIDLWLICSWSIINRTFDLLFFISNFNNRNTYVINTSSNM